MRICDLVSAGWRLGFGGSVFYVRPPTNNDHNIKEIVFGPLYIPSIPLLMGGGLTQVVYPDLPSRVGLFEVQDTCQVTLESIF